MVTQGEVDATRGIWGTAIGRMFESAQEWALVKLREDMVSSELAEVPDGYVLRANAVPLGLMGARHYQMAERIYQTLIAQVDSYIESSGVRRHRGALIANQAVCQILLGNFDSGVPRLQFTAQDEDWQTYGVPPASSYAMTLLAQLFEDPAKETLRRWGEYPWFRATKDRIKIEDYDEVTRTLGASRWSLFAVAARTSETWATYSPFPSTYAEPRLLDGLRGLCASVEHLAKIIGRNSADKPTHLRFNSATRLTLGQCYTGLFQRLSPPWWPTLKALIQKGLTSFDARKADQDFDEKLKQLIALDGSSLDRLTPKALAVSLLMRNYSAHELEPPLHFLSRSSGTPLFIEALTHCAVSFPVVIHASKILGHLADDESGS